LKEFAISMGLEVTAPFIFNDIGFRDLDDFRDIISLTPCQIFWTLFE